MNTHKQLANQLDNATLLAGHQRKSFAGSGKDPFAYRFRDG